jgi:hypothetical protein
VHFEEVNHALGEREHFVSCAHIRNQANNRGNYKDSNLSCVLEDVGERDRHSSKDQALKQVGQVGPEVEQRPNDK